MTRPDYATRRQPAPRTPVDVTAWLVARLGGELREDHAHDIGADLRARSAVGVETYGTPLTAHNGRDPLVDAYQEALDLAVYLAQDDAEQERSKPSALTVEALLLACQIRERLALRERP